MRNQILYCYFEFPDIVINNAGILRDKSFARISDLDWGKFLWFNPAVYGYIWAVTGDFQQCGMSDQQSLRSACAYAQSDQSFC